ncbi:hypothetical protein FBALC1_10607 [Flavobacteriales bacterium ALC-1]|nr:hypothetical protein FBALC1_10607 [Flavobacteriales bacterium ALC-1]
MTIIEKLKYHDDNQLNEWLDYSDKQTKKFCKELVKFAKENETELKQYCINTLPTEYSSLSIIYEALTEYSTSFNNLLFEEIKRVITLAKQKRIKASYLELLTDIEPEDIYSKDEEIYIDCLNFMTSELSINNDKKFNIELLEVIDWFLIELDEDDDITESKNWVNQIKKLANEGEPAVKLKAREVLKNIDSTDALNSMSFFERVKGMFS